MDRNYDFDIIDGIKVPPTIINGDETLTGTHNGSVHVESGSVIVAGKLNGSLHVNSGCSATITGSHNGSLHVGSNADVTVIGEQNGSSHLGEDATVVVEHKGKLAGSLHNNGLVILRGVFGGSESGDGELRVEASGRIKPPTEIRDGVYTYVWSSTD